MKTENIVVFKSVMVDVDKMVTYVEEMAKVGYQTPTVEDVKLAMDNLDDAFGILVNHEDKEIKMSTFYEFERAYDLVAQEI